MTTTTCPPDSRLNGPIHRHFELTYANYLVLPRTLLQSMPEEWQAQFVALLEQFDAAFKHVKQAEAYDVTPGDVREVGCLSDDELAYLGIARQDAPEGDEEDEEDGDENPYYAGDLFYDRDGNEMQAWERVVYPSPDPVPHYIRGRTYIEPMIGGHDA